MAPTLTTTRSFSFLRIPSRFPRDMPQTLRSLVPLIMLLSGNKKRNHKSVGLRQSRLLAVALTMSSGYTDTPCLDLEAQGSFVFPKSRSDAVTSRYRQLRAVLRGRRVWRRRRNHLFVKKRVMKKWTRWWGKKRACQYCCCQSQWHDNECATGYFFFCPIIRAILFFSLSGKKREKEKSQNLRKTHPIGVWRTVVHTIVATRWLMMWMIGLVGRNTRHEWMRVMTIWCNRGWCAGSAVMIGSDMSIAIHGVVRHSVTSIHGLMCRLTLVWLDRISSISTTAKVWWWIASATIAVTALIAIVSSRRVHAMRRVPASSATTIMLLDLLRMTPRTTATVWSIGRWMRAMLWLLLRSMLLLLMSMMTRNRVKARVGC